MQDKSLMISLLQSGEHGYDPVDHVGIYHRAFLFCKHSTFTSHRRCCVVQMRIDKIGVNRDSAHERRRLEIYALNTILCASEDAKLQELIKQHANDTVKDADVGETERMIALAAMPDSDDDKHQGNSPRATKSGYAGSPNGSIHKV